MKLTTSFDAQTKLSLSEKASKVTLVKTTFNPWSTELEEKELGYFQLDKNSNLEFVITGELKINSMLQQFDKKEDIPF